MNKAFALAVAATAPMAAAGVVPISIFENQPNVDLTNFDISLAVTGGADYVDLTFANNSNAGVVTKILVENTVDSAHFGDINGQDQRVITRIACPVRRLDRGLCRLPEVQLKPRQIAAPFAHLSNAA